MCNFIKIHATIVQLKLISILSSCLLEEVWVNQKEEEEAQVEVEVGRVWTWRWRWPVLSAGGTVGSVNQTKPSSTALPKPGTCEYKQYVCVIVFNNLFLKLQKSSINIAMLCYQLPCYTLISTHVFLQNRSLVSGIGSCLIFSRCPSLDLQVD